MLLLLVASGLWAVSWIGARWLIVTEPIDRADAIVVMSGSAAYRERNELAARLYLEGRSPLVILTNDNQNGGWAVDEQRNIPYQEIAERLLRRRGVPEKSMVMLLRPVSGTYDEATLIKEYAAERNLRSILVVTSAYHSRRARWTLHRVFSNSGVTLGFETVMPGWQSPPPRTWWLHLKGWQMVPPEYVKLIYYRLAY